ncbi:hypothetical protein ACS0TY_029349 [Phlomoides rotata]
MEASPNSFYLFNSFFFLFSFLSWNQDTRTHLPIFFLLPSPPSHPLVTTAAPPSLSAATARRSPLPPTRHRDPSPTDATLPLAAHSATVSHRLPSPIPSRPLFRREPLLPFSEAPSPRPWSSEPLALILRSSVSWQDLKVNLLVDASVDDGYHLQISFLHTLRQITGVLAGIYEVLPKHLATEQVSVLMQVILITHVERVNRKLMGIPFLIVTVIKFGHMSSDLLAYGASDGSLTVCTVSTPPSVLKQFTGHTKDVTANNQYIASASIDKTVRVWDIPKGLCMRVIYGVSSQLCIRFNPVSNFNPFIVGK